MGRDLSVSMSACTLMMPRRLYVCYSKFRGEGERLGGILKKRWHFSYLGLYAMSTRILHAVKRNCFIYW
ncbi:hypothetical protein XENTR_v10016635 [Xenopus tropicalis]|nr:hypothetical protein XENTR_v10016635 [Xenopus tropicalis]